MKRKESDYIFYDPNSIFSRVYSELFSILSMLENELHFSQQTKLVALRYVAHFALKPSYFCRLLDCVSFPVSLYCPYAFTCVMIAYKYEENCERVMSVADIISFPNRFCESLSDYSQMEVEVLSVYAFLRRPQSLVCSGTSTPSLPLIFCLSTLRLFLHSLSRQEEPFLTP